MDKYFDFLTMVAEGNVSRSEWLRWWKDNAKDLEGILTRTQFLRLKLQPYRQAQAILSEQGAEYSWDKTKCSFCGTTLFHAVPRRTTSEQIIEFARNSKLANAEQIEAEGWIHPGTYCPNGCIATLAHYRPD